jgi:hypothetical protein
VGNPDRKSTKQPPKREVSEVLCLGSVYFSSFGSDFGKARQRPAVPPEPRGYGGA